MPKLGVRASLGSSAVRKSSLKASSAINFWMDPIDGTSLANRVNLAKGDDTNATENGTPQFQTGTPYSSDSNTTSTVNTITFNRTDNERIIYPNLTEHPWGTISGNKGWFVVMLMRGDGNYGICGNGATADSQAGWNININNGNLRAEFSDGTVRHGETLPGLVTITDGNWHIGMIQWRIDNATTITVRAMIDGWSNNNSQAQRTLSDVGWDLTSDTTPLYDFTVGDVRSTGSNAFNGELWVGGGELPNNTFFDAENVNAIFNYSRGRVYSDMVDRIEKDNVVRFVMGAPTQTELPVVAFTNSPITAKVIDPSNMEVIGTTVLELSQGTAKGVVKGLTADTSYNLEFHEPDGRVSSREGRFRTLPTNNTFDVGIYGCSQWSEANNIEAHLSGIVNTLSPHFGIFNGDFGYVDPDTNNITTLNGFLSRMVDIFNHSNVWSFIDRMPLLLTFDDHDTMGNDTDSTSTLLSLGQDYGHLGNPNPEANFPDVDSFYHSVVRNGIRFIMLDTRLEKTSSEMVSATQLQWLQDEIEVARLLGQIYCIVTPNVWDFNPPDTIDDQTWESSPYSDERNLIFDHIYAVCSTNPCGFTVAGDAHMVGIDDGTNQGNFDDSGNLRVPGIIASRLMQNGGAFKGVWSQNITETQSDGSNGLISFVDNGDIISANFKPYIRGSLQSDPIPMVYNFHKVSSSGYGVGFDAADEKVTLGTSDLSLTGDFSIGFWLKTTDNNGATIISNRDPKEGSNYFQCKIVHSSSAQLLISSPGLNLVVVSVNATNVTLMTDGDWHLHTLLFDRDGNAQWYIDTTIVGTGDMSGYSGIDLGSDEILIASEDVGSPGDLVGTFNDVAIWSKLLTSNEITAIYNSGIPIDLSGNNGNYVSAYDLEGYWRFDRAGTNTQALDSSMNQRHATLSSGVRREISNYYSLNFDGTDAYVDCGGNSSLQITGDMSVSCWFKADTIANNMALLSMGASGETEADNVLYQVFFDTTSGNDLEYMHENSAGNNNNQVIDSNLSVDIWYHLVMTRNDTSNEVKLYIDASQSGSTYTYANSPTGGSNGVLEIGKKEDGNYFDGNILEVAVWNTELSSSEITAIYNSRNMFDLNVDSGDYSSQANLQGWWRMGDGDLDHRVALGLIADQTNAVMGHELNSQSNASSMLYETNATTGWTAAGAAISSNSSVVNNSIYSIHAESNNSPTADARIFIDLDAAFSLRDGSTYKIEFDARHLGTGSANWNIGLSNDSIDLSDSTDTIITTLGSSDTTFARYTQYFVHSANTQYFMAMENNALNIGGVYIDNISVRLINGNPGLISGIVSTDFETETP